MAKTTWLREVELVELDGGRHAVHHQVGVGHVPDMAGAAGVRLDPDGRGRGISSAC